MVYGGKCCAGVVRQRVSGVQKGNTAFPPLVASKCLRARSGRSSSVVVHAERGAQRQRPRALRRALRDWVGGISKEGQHGKTGKLGRCPEREMRQCQYVNLPSPRVPGRARESSRKIGRRR